MSNANTSSRTDAVVKLFVVLLVCLFSFAVGTYVGKKFSDEQAKLAKFEGAQPQAKVATGESEATNLSDEDVLALAKEFMNDESSARTVASVDTQAATAGAKAESSSGPSANIQIETRPATTKDLPSKLAEEIARQAAGKFTVQIASYPQEVLAERRVELLRKDNFNAFYYPTSLVDRTTKEPNTWYRVAIGIFDTQASADSYRKDLLQRAKIESAFVQRLPKVD